MHNLMSGAAGVLLCSAFALTGSAAAGGFAHGGGGFHGFHGSAFHTGFHGLHGFYGRGLYPYSLLGGYYPRYYPYSIYEDDGPDCDFVWVKRTVKHKIVRRGIWTCS